MKPPFRYFGGKQHLAPWIVSLMPAHTIYVEPFAGSAAVLFAKPPVRHEVLNDLDSTVVTFYRVLRERPDELIDKLRLTPYARDEFYACRDTIDSPDIDEIERARRFFVVVSQSFGVTTRRNTGWSSTTLNGASRAHSTQRYVDRLSALADRLRTVVIDARPATKVITQYGATPDAVIYCDPPYLGTTRSRGDNCRTTPTGGYAVEMLDDDAHIELAECLHATPAIVFISGYHSPLYDDLYSDWDRVERQTVSAVARGPARGAAAIDRTRTEVIWSNRPIRDGRIPFGATA